YRPPDWNDPVLLAAPPAQFAQAPADGVAPEQFHATSNHPEYVKRIDGSWTLLRESRMDAVIVARGAELEVVEGRRLEKGDLVAVGRSEDGREGLLMHVTGFTPESDSPGEKFAFRT